MMDAFGGWLEKYCDPVILPNAAAEEAMQHENRRIYGTMETKEMYIRAILDFISGMTDKFAIRLFQEIAGILAA